MSNIISYGVTLPHFQIENHVLDPKFGNNKKGKRTIIFSDEDPVTLAFDAASKCLEEKKLKHTVDAIIFAGITPIFQNRSHASFIAGLLGLRDGIFALDLCTSPKSGTDTIILADNFISSGIYKNILIVFADCKFPEIGNELRNPFGHAGCALLLSEQEGYANIKSTYSSGSFIAEEFIYKGNTVQLDSRFGMEVGVKSNLKRALSHFLEESKLQPDVFDSVILNSIYARSATGLLRKGGFDLEKQLIKDAVGMQTGFTGVCHSILLLIDRLERNSGNILLIDYYNGTNILHVEQTQKTDVEMSSIEECLKNKVLIENYQDYLALRKVGDVSLGSQNLQEIFSSEMMQEREKESLLYLKGFECTKCRTVYFIKARRCVKCKGENFNRKELNRNGIIFTYTKEFYFPSSFPPVNMIVTDLDGGGRVTLQLTDDMYPDREDGAKIGSRVKLVLRKMLENETKPNYFWKCKFIKSK